jgi:hypothetical protein
MFFFSMLFFKKISIFVLLFDIRLLGIKICNFFHFYLCMLFWFYISSYMLVKLTWFALILITFFYIRIMPPILC